MYLKQIEMENFKSFGNKVTVPLLKGYSAVTGPNGSGKSNVSDAILFVLGPKSSKAIRAGRLPDLIFNGGKTRKPAKQTKVSLVFDNEDRTIPLDYDTVKLTRIVRMSSNGEDYYSYFYVNGRKSTLSEFSSLLAKARISADGYNLVQQGDVTRMVEMSNLERRRVLDHISGISVFDEDIERADAEREEAEDNMDRIDIILEELQRQIKQLEEEREAALRYMALRSELETAQAQQAHKLLEATSNEISSIRGQMSSTEEEVGDLRAKRSELATRVSSIGLRISELEREMESRGGDELRELKARMDRVKVDLAMAEDAVERKGDEIGSLRVDMEERAEEIEGVKGEVTEIRSQLEDLDARIPAEAETHSSKSKELEAVKAELGQTDGQVSELEAEVARLDDSIRTDDDKLGGMVLERQRLTGRKERLDLDIADLEERLKGIEFEISDTEWNIRELKGGEKDKAGEVKDLQRRLYELKAEESRLGKELDDLEGAIRDLTRELSQLVAEKDAAESVARGYNRAVDGILAARDRGEIAGIHGTIAELADVEEEHATALNTAAGGRMQAIVVDDDRVASEAIGYLKRNRLGRATFLPLNKMVAGRPRGKAIHAEREGVGYAIDLIRFDPMYRGAFWYVLGDTVVMASLDDARRLMGGVRMVTLGGELLEASGAMVGGTVSRPKLRFGASSENKMKDVSDRLRAAKDAAEGVEGRLREVRADARGIEDEIREHNGAGGANAVRIKALETQRETYAGQRATVKGELEAMASDLEDVSSRLGELVRAISEMEASLRERRTERDGTRARLMEVAPTELSQRLSALQTETFESLTRLNGLRSERETTAARLSMVERRANELEGRQSEDAERISTLEAEREGDSARASELTIELNGLRRIEEGMDQRIKDLREARDGLFQERTGLEAERDSMQSRIEVKQDFSIGLRTKLSLAEDRLRELEGEVASLEVEVELPLPSLESIRSTIKRCEGALSRMGAVNLKAVEDYEGKSGRSKELRSERDRLDAQREELITLTTELNSKKKVAFMEVYEAVDANFREVYADLSGGGIAEMGLEFPDDPFQGGLLIKARPKNGKVLRLQALSGGEKSLTALAFIFAIQEYQPSPFYLLDEVDMFLDAVNAEMVARRVKKGSRSAQFVQISLRKVTLAKAEHLIGVTRQPNGISKVIMRPDMSEVERYEEEAKANMVEGST